LNIFLIGCRGSGKSTVGRMLARRLGREFVDLDETVIEMTGRSIKQIFAEEGEDGFRRREREAVQKVRRLKEHIIALGGGTLTMRENHASLRRTGRFVWLRTPAAVAWSRVSRDPQTAANRPDLTPVGGLSELEAVLAEREPQYEDVAHHIVDTVSDTPEEIAEAIELWFVASDARR